MPATLRTHRQGLAARGKVSPSGLAPLHKAADENDFALTPVPQERRSSLLVLSFQIAGVAICIAGLYQGATLAQGLSLPEVIISTLAGNALGTLCAGLVGAAGARCGISTTMLARGAFGPAGARLIGIVIAVTLIGWYAVQVGFFAQTIQAMCPEGGYLTSVPCAAGWGGILMMITAYFGYRGLAILSMLAVPALFVLTLLGVASVLGTQDALSYIPPSHLSLSQGITMVVGGFAVGTVIQADLTRYAKCSRDAWLATIFGFLIANSYIITAGAITVICTSTADLPRAMLSMGLGFPALMVLILAQWTTNDNNLYSTSLGLSGIFRIKKSSIVLAAGLIATAIGVWGLAERFIPWLLALGIAIPPIAGVIIADYWFLRRGNFDVHAVRDRPALNLCALLSWACGAGAGILLPFGIPALNAILVSFLVYLAVMHAFCRHA